jgi:N-acetylmuramoyl-L-alanine amidase
MKILKLSKNTIQKTTFIFFTGILFLFSVTITHAQRKYTVVLDAGHGGKDSGGFF